MIRGKRAFDIKYICQFSSAKLHPLMLHPIWINIGLIINMFKHFLMYISWWEDLCLFYDDKIFRAQGIFLCCHRSPGWALFTLPEGASLSLLGKAQAEKVSAACTEGLFCGSEVIWSMRRGREGRTASAWAAAGACPPSAEQAQPSSSGDGRGSDLERLVTGSASKAAQTRGSDSWKTCTEVSKERERETNAALGRL